MYLEYYSGVGSRECPEDVGAAMTRAASYLETKGYILRSGGAPGADTFFENGVKDSDNKHIYLPSKGFNGNQSPLYYITDEALELAATIHPAWHRCKPYARKLHARNTYQVLGFDLKTPSSFVLCWTPNGEIAGGTATAIRLAKKHDIPVFNYGNVKSKRYDDAFEQFMMLVK